jgi:hypothetical protein
VNGCQRCASHSEAATNAASRNRERRNHFTNLKNPFLNEKISSHISRDALRGEHGERARRCHGVSQPHTIRDGNAGYRDG